MLWWATTHTTAAAVFSFAFGAIHIRALVFGCARRHPRPPMFYSSCMCLAFSVTVVRSRVLATYGKPRVKRCRAAAWVKFYEGARTSHGTTTPMHREDRPHNTMNAVCPPAFRTHPDLRRSIDFCRDMLERR